MTERVWTAEELEQMTPDEVDALFASSIVGNLENVPPEFLQRVRDRTQQRIRDIESRNA